MSLFDRIKNLIRPKSIQQCPAAKGTLVTVLNRGDTGAPIANAKVAVRGPTPGSGVTDELGSLILTGRSPGNYEASFTLPTELAKQSLRVTPASVSGTVSADGVATLEAEATGVGHIMVEVFDDSPALVTDAIIIRLSGTQAVDKNTMQGNHLFGDLPTGSYTVSATVPASRYVVSIVKADPVTVTTGNTAKVRIDVKVKPKVVSIAFLNGGDTTEVASATQWVNLTRSDSFVDGTHVANLDRTGYKPRLKVRFDKPGAHHFTVKCVPQGSNAAYTPGESGRNARFLYQKDEKSYTTGGDGSLILPLDDFFVAAAGKDKYSFEAKDDYGVMVKTGDLETKRLVYYVEIKMMSLTTAADSLATLEGEYLKHNIKLVKLPGVPMDDMPNIGAADSDTFKLKARTGYSGSQAVGKQPHSIAIAYTGHLAVKNPDQPLTKVNVTAGPGHPAVEVPVMAPGLTSSGLATRYLWQDIVSGEGWFVSAKFRKNGGSAADDVDIPESACAPVPVRTSMANKIKIDVSALPAETGTITLQVNVVDRMRAGLSFPDSNLICVCTKAWWSNESTASQNEVIVHELGHSVGMVADGTGKLPDKTTGWYDNSKGHVGDHCFNGIPAGQARYDADADQGLSKCVMYGATNGYSAFCADCTPALRKVDISDGWPAF